MYKHVFLDKSTTKIRNIELNKKKFEIKKPTLFFLLIKSVNLLTNSLLLQRK